jgi:drug/metabolite transporter (DMT)-like permease
LVAPYIAAAIGATLLFGLAAVALKQGVSRGLPTLTFRELVDHPFTVVGKLLRNGMWLSGLALYGVGGGLYAVALAQLDLTIVKPIITFYVVVAALLGATLLHERITRIEIFGIAVAVVGASMLGLQGEAMTGDLVHLGEQYRGMVAITLLCIGLSVVAALPTRIPALERLVGRETSLSAVSGINWGLGTAWYKLLANELFQFPSVEAAGGVMAAALTPAFYGDLLTSPALWLLLVLNVVGFGVYQLAFASGRVAVVTPIVMAATMVAPLIAGGWVYGEDLPPLKVAGIATVAVGTVILMLGKGGSGETRAPE